jgi:diacylglycerol kinase family enzyme
MAQRTRQLRGEGALRTVVAAGGDGTASLVLSVIPNDVPLTLFPLGSENLLAKYLGIAPTPDQIVAMVEQRVSTKIDLFEANNKLMLLMASAGFDADVVRRVHSHRTSHVSRWTYWRSILSALGGYRWPQFRIATHSGDGVWQDHGSVNWLFAFNVPKYAAGISIMSDACCDDGWLDVGAFRGGRLGRGLWHYALVAMGRHRRASSWSQWKVKGLRLESAIAPSQDSESLGSYQLDGDWGGPLPLEILSTGRSANLLIP